MAVILSTVRPTFWDLPTDGPKTINGLVLEYLESIPDPGVSVRMGEYVIEVIQTSDNAIKTVRIRHLQSELEQEE